MTVPTIRAARTSDAQDIAQLTAQLGYDVTASSVTQRLSRILSRQDQYFLVAEVDGDLVGWMHAAISEYVESGAFVVIGGLVVDGNHRRKGIGRALMKHGEEWAKKQGCSVVRLWSSAARNTSHQFYEQIGYTHIKTQYSFLKSLDAARGEDMARFVPRV
ncbi:MAG: GNAT family N-acetyltransferase [Acidobacteria bacterium]|nr:GNAT family N-acetyltransferase [Acidobacteriota bacterium]